MSGFEQDRSIPSPLYREMLFLAGLSDFRSLILEVNERCASHYAAQLYT